MIQGMFDSGSMPTLERLVQFTGERHRLVLHNIANLSTPNFRPADLSVSEFQKSLRAAIDRRRSSASPQGPLDPADTRHLRFRRDGIEAGPITARDNILFHDRNDRSLERQMQTLAENAMAHNAALQMMRSKFDLLESTIREQA